MLSGVMLLLAWQSTAEVLFQVEAGRHARRDTPVAAPLQDLKIDLDAPLRLEEVREGKTVATPCQVDASNPPRLWWVLRGKTPAGTKRLFRLREHAPEPAPQVTVAKDDSALTLSIGGAQVLRYHHAIVPPPPGWDHRYRRSGFIHPLWSPSGVELTRIHPADHIHHMGLWAPWTKTLYAGQSIDFWNLNAGQGTVRFARFLDQESGPVFGGFKAQQEHVWLQAPEGERVVLHEMLRVRLWNLGAPARQGWLLDYGSTLRCATDEALLLQAYRYGGLGFRGTERWHNDNSDYLTSEGKTRLDGDGTSARWCDVFGNTGDGVEGILFMSHPENQAHPEPMRIWPASINQGRGNVFFNFCPIRHEDWLLEPGRDHVLRYRLYGHAGQLTKEEADRLWRDFAEPPVVRRLAETEFP